MLPCFVRPAGKMWRECIRYGLLLSALFGLSVPVAAHEFWIEPANFQPPAGKPVDVRLMVGQEFRGDTMIYLPESFERFVTVNARGTRNIPGVPGDDPAARLTPAEPGLLLIAYQSTRYSLEMDSPTFEKYLEKEGLDGIRKLRAQRGVQGKPVREVYSRCAKSLLAVGGRDDGLDARQADRPAAGNCAPIPGSPIETRPESGGTAAVREATTRQCTAGGILQEETQESTRATH